jgi:hypothetical protein
MFRNQKNRFSLQQKYLFSVVISFSLNLDLFYYESSFLECPHWVRLTEKKKASAPATLSPV